MSKLDTQVLLAALKSATDQVLNGLPGIVPTSDAESKEVDIVEYYGRMRALSMNDFNASIYISVINYYLSDADKERNKPKGALLTYVDSENAGKLYKGMELGVVDDEDDASMMAGCAKLCIKMSEGVKSALTNQGFAPLVASEPQTFKNSITHGVNFSLDQKKKAQMGFFFWKRKALVVELTLASIPQK